MKLVSLSGLVAFAFVSFITTSASAMSAASPNTIGAFEPSTIQVKGGHGHGGRHGWGHRGGRGHHYGWSRGRGHHYGWRKHIRW